MKKYSLYISLLMLLFAVSSCQDFLDRPPYDSIPDTEYWQNEEHIRTYAYGFYPTFFVGYGTSGLISGSLFGNGDTFNDDIAWNVQGEFTPIRIPDSDGGWSFATVRKANYMLEMTAQVTGLTEEAMNHWIGIGRFFRGMQYANLVFAYGDVPWYDKRLETSNRDEMFKDRDPRSTVVGHIIEDFEFALKNVRKEDGELNINRYVVAAMVSRLMLREGTFQKYHNLDQDLAVRCLKLSRDASLEVMNSHKFSVSDNYNALFSSDDLMSNPEVIFYRKYLGGILTHCTLTYNNAEAQTGASRALLEAYLTADGLPVHMDDSWAPKTADEFFADRDPRLTATFRKKFYIRGEDCTPFNYSTSGYSMCKFMDDSQANSEDLKYRGQNNETDCPLLRLGEVLVNYAEARYELGELTQDDLNNSINLLRSRKGMSIPKLEIIGNEPAVNGVVYDDPKRDKDVPSLLWEIRRERRVEMCFEGLRYSDLKRWKKLDYMCNETNPDILPGILVRSDTDRYVFRQVVPTDNHGAGMNPGLPDRTFQLHRIFQRILYQRVRTLHLGLEFRKIFDTIGECRFFRIDFLHLLAYFPLFSRTVRIVLLDILFHHFRDIERLVRDKFCKAVGLGKRQLVDTGDILNGALGRHRSESHDMRNMVLPVFFLDIPEHLITSVIIEIYVDIRHRDAVRIEKTLEQQLVFYRVHIGYSQTICHGRTCRRTPSRPNRHAPALRLHDEVLHYQEVIRKTHPLDGLQLEINPLLRLHGHVRITFFRPLVSKVPQVFVRIRKLFGYRENRKDMPRVYIVIFDLFRHIQRIRYDFRMSGEQGGHLLLAFKIFLLGISEPVLRIVVRIGRQTD